MLYHLYLREDINRQWLAAYDQNGCQNLKIYLVAIQLNVGSAQIVAA